MNRKQQGDARELAAVAFLRSKGYRIVATQYRCSVGEIDIIALDGEELVFVEVRSRADHRFGGAAYAIGPKKQQQVIRVAQAYLAQSKTRYATYRFDAIAITGERIEHFVDAFRS